MRKRAIEPCPAVCPTQLVSIGSNYTVARSPLGHNGLSLFSIKYFSCFDLLQLFGLVNTTMSHSIATMHPRLPLPESLLVGSILVLVFLAPLATGIQQLSRASKPRVCLERIWPDFQRCRERQREQFHYGRFSSGVFLTSSDAYQPKYKMECCSYWELLECVHKAANIYCNDDINLKTLDKFVEMVGLNVPLYICSDEYPKGSFRCKIPSWFALTLGFIIIFFIVLMVLLFICIRRSK